MAAKKILISFTFFLSAFVIISLAADFCYVGRNASSDPSGPDWPGQPDFEVFWQTGKNASQTIAEKTVSDDFPIYDKKELFYHFRYTPIMAFMMIPFGNISFTYASLFLWVLLANLALLFAIVLLRKNMKHFASFNGTVEYAVVWAAFMGTLRYYLMIIGQGQTDTFVALLLVLFLIAYTKNKEILCGIILAFILQMKLFFLPCLVYFLLRGKIKLIISTVISFAAFLFMPAAIIGMERTLILTKTWIDMLGLSVPSQLVNFKNQSVSYGIFKVLSRFTALPAKATIYALSASLTVFLYIALSIFRKKLKDLGQNIQNYYDISIVILVSVLFSPISWEAYYVCLIIPISLTLYLAMQNDKKKLMFLFLAAYFVLSCVIGTDITKFIPGVNSFRFINISLGTSALTFVLLRSCSKAPKPSVR